MMGKIIWVGIFLFVFLAVVSGQVSQQAEWQYYQPSFQTYYSGAGGTIDYKTLWPILAEPEKCKAQQDFIVQIRPGGCMPAVVRSDLLEEQNVPVFCKLDAIKLNPLIDVAAIKSVRFSGQYPKEVAGISFHPSKAALKMYTKVLTSPFLNDAGYVVIVLKRQEKEKSMPKIVEGNLTAVLYYDMENVFGAGKTRFYLPVIDEKEWEQNYKKYGFWRGKGYLRLEYAEKDRAGIAIYLDNQKVLGKVSLKKGETSNLIYMPGFYCSGGIQLRLNDLTIGKTRALIKVDENEFWLMEGERFLENNCYVRKIIGFGGGAGQVVLNCRNKEIVLSVGFSGRVELEKTGGGKFEKEIGEEIIEGNDKIYIAYIGKAKFDDKDKEEKLFVILAKNVNANKLDSEGKIEQKTLGFIIENFDKWKKEKTDWQANVKKEVGRVLGGGEVEIVKQDKAGFDYVLKKEVGLREEVYENDVGKKLEQYFKKTKSVSDELIRNYGNEKKESGEFFGARVLWELSELAGRLNKFETQKKILFILKDKYSASSLAREAELKLEDLGTYEYGKASTLVQVGIKTTYVKLESVYKPGYEEASAEFMIPKDGKTETKPFLIGEHVLKEEKPGDEGEYIKLENLDDDKIFVEYKHKVTGKEGGTIKTEKKEMKRGDSLFIEGNKKRATLTKINLKRVAEVEVISKIPDGISEANFSFHIGIEKRAIKLSPDKALEKITNLNETINKWEKINTKLGDLVKNWKAACFVTSAGLIVKNFFSNLGGKALARQNAMSGYWKTKCAEEVSAGGADAPKTLDECYMKYSKEIGNSVDEMAKSMKSVNDKVAEANKNNSKDRQKATEEFAGKFKSWKKEEKNKNIKIKVGGKDTTLESLTDAEMIDEMVKNGELSMSDMRDIMMYGELYNKGGDTSKMGQAGLQQKLEPVFEYQEEKKSRSDYESALKEKGLDIKLEGISAAPGTREIGRNVQTIGKNSLYIKEGNYISVQDSSNYYLIAVDKAGDSLVPRKIDDNNVGYKLSKNGGGNVVATGITKEQYSPILSSQGIGKIVEINREFCRNKYLNPKVKYFENEPQKGMPAIVPVDEVNGWYAATKQVIPGFGIKSFTSAGSVSSLYLCNVGKNGREEFQSTINDDKPCIQINYDTGQPLGELVCLNEGEARRLALKARRCVEDAASQYSSEGRVNTQCGSFGRERALKTAGIECQDFMSPQDCTTLFNVCDPVICPSSRCDFGGRFPVDDVVQSGIIGSILLCLPNFGSPTKGRVLVPVCLTGIHAGIDGYLSVMKAYRDCLQENVNTGRMTGICDEIYSIYLCEFFWRQAAPIMDVLVPKIIEYVYTGGRMQGGGEYMSVQSAWGNMEKSRKYFTDYYGLNTFKVFRMRSTAEVGSEVCKMFISTRYPSKISKLLEPESPVQFHAWFDEIPFSDASVPPTSQYKVFYHIFAGKDAGHYYSVYLKSPPETGYYSSQPYIVVDSGYAGIGQTIDKTRDFTAPASYKELCVRIDTKEECGFKSVSTSMALNYLKDEYAKQQVKENIDSEKECVAGSTSLYAMAQPNIQEGVQEAIQPEIYKRGIIRVCSTDNPGERTNPGRWKQVGYCDDTKMKCWLDSKSVESAIKDTDLEKEALTEAQKKMNELKEKQPGEEYKDEGQTNELLQTANKNFDEFSRWADTDKFGVDSLTPDKIKDYKNGDDELRKLKNLLENIELIKNSGFFNNQRARAYVLEFNVYKKITEKLAEKFGVIKAGKKVEVVAREEGEKKVERSYKIEDIYFEITPSEKDKNKLNTKGEKESTAYTTQKIELAVENEENCDSVNYDIILDIKWWFDKTKLKGISKSDVDKFFANPKEGKYYIRAYCYEGNNIKSKAQSGFLTIKEVEPPAKQV